MTRNLLLSPASIVAILTATVSSGTLAQQPQNQRVTLNFNAGWRVNVGDAPGAEAPAFNDATWKAVTLPHAWNEDSAFKVTLAEVPTSIAWYRKTFTLPSNAFGKKVFLEFEGIRQGGDFYLNGQPIGWSGNGVMAFGFDISDQIKPGQNVLAVKTDNSWFYRDRVRNSGYEWNDRNFYPNYGGINRNVKLHITNKLYQTLPLLSNLGTTGVYIYAKEFDIPGKSATVTAEAQVKNEYSEPRTFDYEVSVVDPSGKVVKTFAGPRTTLAAGQSGTVSASSRIQNLEFWSWGYGALYDVTTTLGVNGQPVDSVTTRTGFRKTEFGNGVFKLNNRTVQLKGYAPRSTNEWPALGVNVPPWMSDFSNRLAVEDNANIMRWMHVTPSKQDVESCDRVGLMETMPAGDAEKDVTGPRWEQRVELMREATVYMRNNPSIIFYESGNNQISEEHMSEMKAVRDKYDPYGGRAAGSRNMQNSKVAEYGGEMLYINKSATEPMWMMEYSRDEGLRLHWDEFSPPYHKEGDGPLYRGQPGLAWNHNQDALAIEDVRRWYDYWRERPGTGRRVNSGGAKIIWADSQSYGRGPAPYRVSGAVDGMRLPKDAFYAHQVMWDGWVDVEKPRAHILGHWNYAPTVKKPIYVVSSADKVELFLDGKSLGFGRQEYRFLFTFPDVQWEPGTLRAVGYNGTNKQICEDTKVTVGDPVALKLTPVIGPGGWKADGSDIVMVDVEVVDAQGRRCPTALNPITYNVSGPAEWRGGIAFGPYILAKTMPVEGGISRVMLRSLPQAGNVALTASASGLKAATLELRSHFAPTNLLPGADVPSFLGRGPTPAGDSVVPTRIPLRIAKASTGSNADQLEATWDDNETTSWSSDGKLANAWVAYELPQAGPISEVSLKMGGFRTRSYPLRLFVDDKQVFEGWTPPSLSYVTLTFPPTVGKTLKIQLIGNSREGDAAPGVTELQNAANAAVTGDTKAKGTLVVIEAELYAPVGGEIPTANIWQPSTPLGAVVNASAPSTPKSALVERKPVEDKPAAPGTTETTVAFRLATEKRYVTAISGGVDASGKKIGSTQTFVLVDLNGGELAEDDAVQIKLAPAGSRATYLHESESAINRVSKLDNAATFKVKLKAKTSSDALQTVILQTASGKFVAVPAAGVALATTDAEDKAVVLEIVNATT